MKEMLPRLWEKTQAHKKYYEPFGAPKLHF